MASISIIVVSGPLALVRIGGGQFQVPCSSSHHSLRFSTPKRRREERDSPRTRPLHDPPVSSRT